MILLIGFGTNLLENAKILFKYIINRACSLSRHQCYRIHSTEYIYSFCDRFSLSQLLAAYTCAQKDKVVRSIYVELLPLSLSPTTFDRLHLVLTPFRSIDAI